MTFSIKNMEYTKNKPQKSDGLVLVGWLVGLGFFQLLSIHCQVFLMFSSSVDAMCNFETLGLI